jgi:hypothetical protein
MIHSGMMAKYSVERTSVMAFLPHFFGVVIFVVELVAASGSYHVGDQSLMQWSTDEAVPLAVF